MGVSYFKLSKASSSAVIAAGLLFKKENNPKAMIEIISNSRTLYKGAQLFTALSFFKRAEQLGNTVVVTGDPKVMVRWAIILQNL